MRWLLLCLFLGILLGGLTNEQQPVKPPPKPPAMHTYQKENEQARKLLSKIFGRDMTHFRTGSMEVTLTAYSATPEETNEDPSVTAFNVPSRIGIVALSRDLEAVFNPGELILLPNYGLFKVQDRMSTHKHKGTNPVRITNTIDILHATPRAAKLFGVKKHEPVIFIMD